MIMRNWWINYQFNQLRHMPVSVTFTNGTKLSGPLLVFGDQLCIKDGDRTLAVFEQNLHGDFVHLHPTVKTCWPRPEDSFWQGRFPEELEGYRIIAATTDGHLIKGVIHRLAILDDIGEHPIFKQTGINPIQLADDIKTVAPAPDDRPADGEIIASTLIKSSRRQLEGLSGDVREALDLLPSIPVSRKETVSKLLRHLDDALSDIQSSIRD